MPDDSCGKVLTVEKEFHVSTYIYIYIPMYLYIHHKFKCDIPEKLTNSQKINHEVQQSFGRYRPWGPMTSSTSALVLEFPWLISGEPNEIVVPWLKIYIRFVYLYICVQHMRHESYTFGWLVVKQEAILPGWLGMMNWVFHEMGKWGQI